MFLGQGSSITTALVAFSSIFAVVGQTTVETDQAPICSVSEPSSSQVCVSIKFPWTENPVFFCTDQGNINYKPQCTDPSQSHHCFDDGRMDTMKIATPWDCCPIISTPNRCSNVECPPEPFNRTCKIIKTLGDCCPTYFCDAGVPFNCKTSRLKPDCIRAPKHKANCTVFRDPFGCCNKFQCFGDQKAGICPIKRREARDRSSSSTFHNVVNDIVTGAKETVHKVTTGVKSTLEKHGGEFGKAISKSIPVPFGPRIIPPSEILRCTGDYTCPGTMKCCRPAPLGYTVAHRRVHRQRTNGVTITTMQMSKSEHRRAQAQHQPIDGICVEPDPEGTMVSSSQAYDQYSVDSTQSTVQDVLSSTAAPSTPHSVERTPASVTFAATFSPSTEVNNIELTTDRASPTSTEILNLTPITVTSSTTDGSTPSVTPADNKPDTGANYTETVVEA